MTTNPLSPADLEVTAMDNRQKVKCTRCRYVHDFGDRIKGRPDKYGARSLECPQCGGHIYKEIGKRVEG